MPKGRVTQGDIHCPICLVTQADIKILMGQYSFGKSANEYRHV